MIKHGESETLEFKSSLSSANEIVESISAFSNKDGGRILIGVSPSGKILEITIGKDTLEKLANKIVANTDPRVYPRMTVEKINEKNVIVIEVKESMNKPVLAFGRPFKRVGKSTLKIGRDEYERMILDRRKIYWDEQICEAASLKDINEEKVRRFLKKARYERRLKLNTEVSVREALEKLGLLREGKLTNAAILLFGKYPQKIFSQAETRCARFKGTKPLEFIDMKVFAGNIIDQREDALEFVKEHIKMEAKIVETERIERWEYPIEAIREAITNAICHRDYGIKSNVQVRIFDDRIEIWGCGLLPKPLTLEDLKKEHKSILRNPLIGKCFFLIKFIEEWGTGTNRIIEWCLKHGLPEPIFEEASGSLVVTLRKYRISDEDLKKLNERQRKAAEYLKIHRTISRSQYTKLTNSSERTAFRDLEELLEKNIVVRKGRGKKTCYELG